MRPKKFKKFEVCLGFRENRSRHTRSEAAKWSVHFIPEVIQGRPEAIYDLLREFGQS